MSISLDKTFIFHFMLHTAVLNSFFCKYYLRSNFFEFYLKVCPPRDKSSTFYIDSCQKLWYTNCRTTKKGVSPSGKAQDFDSSIRKFKSCYPCQQKWPLTRSGHFCCSVCWFDLALAPQVRKFTFSAQSTSSSLVSGKPKESSPTGEYLATPPLLVSGLFGFCNLHFQKNLPFCTKNPWHSRNLWYNYITI